jgi:cobyric acid synthase CobQ
VVEGCFLGRTDLPLGDEGLAQADALAAWLKATGHGARALLCSPMLRARQTAAPIAEALGLTITVHDDLREIDCGDWETLTFAQVQARDPDTVTRWASGDTGFAFPGGESLAHFAERMDRMAALIATTDAPLVVCHGGVTRALLLRWLRLPAESRLAFQPRYAAMSVVKWHGGPIGESGGVLEGFNLGPMAPCEVRGAGCVVPAPATVAPDSGHSTSAAAETAQPPHASPTTHHEPRTTHGCPDSTTNGCPDSTTNGCPDSTPHPAPRTSHQRRKALMLLGTGSDVGKSVLVAGLCRMLRQDGIRVAPFKAQNMSNNAGVGIDGGEMGRAQIVQAQACGIPPDTRMNPVLIKPTADTRAQIIVRGQAIGHLGVQDYIDYKAIALPAALAAYDSLAADYDMVILEGAGSCGEMNLRAHDIVNLGFARHRDIPAILVGDIDKGGVYASFIGHHAVLDDADRRLLRGFLVNKFRGDASLLAPAHAEVERRTGLPVLGVVPWLPDLGLPEEDRIANCRGAFATRPDPSKALDLAVLHLRHAANISDCDALMFEPDVSLRVVRTPADLGTPDLILIPGSKNTGDDLAHLRACGLADAVLRLHAARHTPIIGLCGGLQMLGHTVADPLGLESSSRAPIPGLGLLPLTTVLAADKTLTRRSARHLPTGLPAHGYEIHHGATTPLSPGDIPANAPRLSPGSAAGPAAVVHAAIPWLTADDGTILGWSNPTGTVCGTYLHGLFDADALRRHLLDRLRITKGLAPLTTPARFDLEPALDRLAEHLRRCVRWADLMR